MMSNSHHLPYNTEGPNGAGVETSHAALALPRNAPVAHKCALAICGMGGGREVVDECIRTHKLLNTVVSSHSYSYVESAAADMNSRGHRWSTSIDPTFIPRSSTATAPNATVGEQNEAGPKTAAHEVAVAVATREQLHITSETRDPPSQLRFADPLPDPSSLNAAHQNTESPAF